VAEFRALPVEQRERFVTRTELAELMGISVQSVDRMIAKGAPHERWGMRAVRVLPSRFIQWAREQERNVP
jgi:phage terminase Nu1 subunit (DNA packaging protein)